MKHEPRIQYTVALPDFTAESVAQAVTEACGAMTAAAIRSGAFVGGPTSTICGRQLVLRWSTERPSIANDILGRHLQHCNKKCPGRFSPFNPAAVPSPMFRNAALPEFSDPVGLPGPVGEPGLAVSPPYHVYNPTALAESIGAEDVVLPVITTGETLTEDPPFAPAYEDATTDADRDAAAAADVAEGDVAADAAFNEAVYARNDALCQATAATPPSPAPADPVPNLAQGSPTTADGVAIVRGLPVLVAQDDGSEPRSGIVVPGPAGKCVNAKGVLVKIDGAPATYCDPAKLTASKE